jgi:hypothetical protein
MTVKSGMNILTGRSLPALPTTVTFLDRSTTIDTSPAALPVNTSTWVSATRPLP